MEEDKTKPKAEKPKEEKPKLDKCAIEAIKANKQKLIQSNEIIRK